MRSEVFFWLTDIYFFFKNLHIYILKKKASSFIEKFNSGSSITTEIEDLLDQRSHPAKHEILDWVELKIDWERTNRMEQEKTNQQNRCPVLFHPADKIPATHVFVYRGQQMVRPGNQWSQQCSESHPFPQVLPMAKHWKSGPTKG